MDRRFVGGRARLCAARVAFVAAAALGSGGSAAAQNPPAIEYATYLGSGLDERIVAVDVDNAGNLYVLGATSNPAFFPTTLSVGRPSGSQEACFLSKLDPTGSQLLYSILFRDTAQLAPGLAFCDAMTVGPNGSAYVVYQSVDGAFVKTLATVTDTGGGTPTVSTALVKELEGFVAAPAVKADAGGYVYILGGCFNTRVQMPSPYPLPGGFRTTPNPGRCATLDNFFSIGLSESVVVKVDKNGSVVYGTFVAGDRDNAAAGQALAVDAFHNLYVAGRTVSDNFPVTSPQSAFQSVCATDNGDVSCDDGFLLKIDPFRAGALSLTMGTFLGGPGPDGITGLSVAPDGSLTVIGETGSASFPIAWAPEGTAGATVDASQGALFAARFNLAEVPINQLVWATTLPTHSVFEGVFPHLATLSNGSFAVAGMTENPQFPLVQELPIDTAPAAGSPRPFISHLSADASTLRFSSFLGKGSYNFPRLAARRGDELYVGIIETEFDRATSGAYQLEPAGGFDAFLFKIGGFGPANTAPTVEPIFPVTQNASSINGASVQLFAAFVDPDNDPVVATFTGPLGSYTTGIITGYQGRGGVAGVLDFPVGTSTFTVTVSDDRGGSATATSTVTVLGEISTTSGTVHVRPQPILDTSFAFPDPLYTPIVDITIAGVTGPGVTTINARTDAIPATLPDGWQLGSPPYYYDIRSTVSAAGPYTVCVDTTGMTFADTNLRMFVHNDGLWTDATVPAIGSQVCGSFATLGTFVVIHPAAPTDAAVTVAGSGLFLNAIDGPGGDPRDDFIDGGPATASVLAVGQGGLAFDAAHGLLYTTTFAHVRRINLNTGVMNNIAGDGVVGSFVNNPDDNSIGIIGVDAADARTTHVTNPNQLAVDAQGHVYLGEYCQVRRIDRHTNAITTVAGDGYCRYRGDGGPAIAASFRNVWAIAFDAAGGLLIGDYGRIRRVDATGTIQTVAGNGSQDVVPGPAFESGFAAPFRLAVAPNGDVYFTQADRLLFRISAGSDGLLNGGAGEELSIINSCALSSTCPDARYGGDGGPVSQAIFLTLYSVAVEANGDVLIGDNLDHRIRRIAAGADGVLTGTSADEIVSTAVGFNPVGRSGQGFGLYERQDNYALSSPSNAPWGIAIDPRGGGFFYVNGLLENVRRVGGPPATSANRPPVANAGPDQVVRTQSAAELVQLDGSLSSDPDDDALSYVWTENGVVLGTGRTIDTSLPIGSHTITLTVSDPPGLTASDTVFVTIEEPIGSDLSIAASISTPTHVLDIVTYSAIVTNHGPDIAGVARVNIAVAPGVEILGAVIPSGVCEVIGQAIVCDRDLLAVDASVVVTITARPLRLGSFATTFVASNSQGDPNLGNNTAELTAFADLVIDERIEVSDTMPAPGLSVVVIIEESIAVGDEMALPNSPPIADAGPDQRHHARGPRGTLVHLVGTGSDPDGGTVQFTWSEGGTVLGNTASLDLGLSPGLHVFTLSVSDRTFTTTDTVQVEILPPTGLVLSAFGPAMAHAGAPFTYTATIDNLGPGVPPIARLTVALPANIEFVSAGHPLGFCIIGTQVVTCDVPSLAAGASVDVAITLKPHVVGTFTTTFTLTGDEVEPDTYMDSVTVTTTSALVIDENIAVDEAFSRSQPNLIIGSGSVSEWQTANTTTVLTNFPLAVLNTTIDSPIAPGPITLTAVLPAGFTYDSFIQHHGTPAACSSAGQVVTCTVPFIAGSISLEVAVQVAPTVVGIGETSVRNVIATLTAPDDASPDGNERIVKTLIVRGPIGIQIPVGGRFHHQLVDPQGISVPVTITFEGITQAGYATAFPMAAHPPLPSDFLLKGMVYDIVTTAQYVPPVSVCFLGTFGVNDELLHFENGQWAVVTNVKTNTIICGLVSSLSPFAVAERRVVNHPPQASAGNNQVVEATSAAGALVTLAGAGSDPDMGDPITFKWTEGAVTLGTTASITATLSLGTHDVTLTVTDSHGAAATASTRVVVSDTKAPAVTPPASITVPATESGGTRASAWPALAAYLAAGSAADTVDAAPVRVKPQTGGVDVDANALFAIGKTTTVTFRFRDASGNEGRATSRVTVVLGAPKIKVQVVNKGTVSGTKKFVDLEFTNRGDGNARHATLNLIVLLPLKGSGVPRLASPSLPVTIGALDAGATTRVRIEFVVPAAVKQLSISEIGIFRNVKGIPGAFLEIQIMSP